MFKTKSPVLNILKLCKIMKIIKKTSILAMLVFGLMSCNSETESLEFEEANLTSKQSKSLESTVNHRHAGNTDLVHLGVAGDFTILSKSGVTNVPGSVITGDVGTSPIAQTAITGFGLTLDASGEFATSAQVNGNIYAASAASPTPSMLTTAVLDMQAAYTDAASRPVSSDAHLNVGAGNIGGETLVPGVYKWTSTLLIPEDITLAGGPNDVWIFQVAGTLTMSNGKKMNLSGGAKAKNIFWQVSGAVTLGTTSHFEGILLGATSIAVQTNAIVNGRLLAQTAVTLQMNTVTEPVAEPVAVAIGDLREGGVVFWVDPLDNSHGLVCAFSDYATLVKWGCNSSNLPNVPNVTSSPPTGPGAEIGDGMGNTNAILNNCPTAPAALAARSLGADWFLPSAKELYEMYLNKTTLEAVVGFSAFGNTQYWSSTEYHNRFAWYKNFGNGNQNYYDKNFTSNVRAVRAF
jgi:hypothetical protein